MNNGSNHGLPNVVAVATAPNYGRFAIGPVEAGISVTLGNALRRILLSSLPGSAITSVRIQNIYHEFSCIPNVREDVTEIVVNVKRVRLRSYSERPVRLQLTHYGSGEARAGDVELPANVELVNPDQVIATLDGDDAHLDMELTVERGRGYVSFEAREGLPIGTIPVDAIFSPVPKVNYLVQTADHEVLSATVDEDEEAKPLSPSDVEGKEQLLIEIWTDGTIEPGEALSLAAQYLAQHSSLISNFNREVPQPAGRDLPGTVAIPPHLFEMPIDDLNLSMRTYNCLKRSGVTKVGQVLRMDKKELLGLRNFGDKSFVELHESLSSRDLIPAGTPLALSAGDEVEADTEDGDEDGDDQSLVDVSVDYADMVEGDETTADAYMEGPGGVSDDTSRQIVDAAGVSEGTLAAASGIMIDDEPASGAIDIQADPAPGVAIVQGGDLDGDFSNVAPDVSEDNGAGEEADAKPKARARKGKA